MRTEISTFALGAQDHRQKDEPLWQFLQGHRATPVEIDLSAVPEATTARLELLISARKQWQADEVSMVFVGMRETFSESLSRLGVPEHFFGEGGLQ